MVTALYINGIFQSVLEEILSSQITRPGEPHFLQPYYPLTYTQLRDSKPTTENPITLYASVTSDLHHVSYVGEIVCWEDKTDMSPQRKDEVDSRIKARNLVRVVSMKEVVHQPTGRVSIYSQ